jgi:soluble lytic murein transglycosylase
MRQESRFDPEARSGAAARGLMQLIPATADKLAAELGRPPVDPEDLYSPAVSIRLGAQYVADLFRQFPDKPEAVAAAYNGGEDNVVRWLARSHATVPDLYVSEIQFTQSKEYVFRVMVNYRAYTYLYDEHLRPIDHTLAPPRQVR